jgi:hypothetical protein
VVTLMTDDQQGDVRDLTRKAGIRPTTTRTRPGDALLAELAPGERVFSAPSSIPAPVEDQPTGRSGVGRGRGRSAGTHAAPARDQGSGQGGRGQGRRGQGGQPSNGPAQGCRTPTGQARGRRGGTGSTPVHTSQSRGAATHNTRSSGTPTGGAAAFSSGTRVGGRRGSR